MGPSLRRVAFSVCVCSLLPWVGCLRYGTISSESCSVGSALGLRGAEELGGCLASSQFGDCWVCKQLWGYLRPQRWGCRIGVSDPRVRFYVYGV